MKDGGPAFPQAATIGPQGDVIVGGHYFADAAGMSLRDYFATHATDGDIAWAAEMPARDAKTLLGLPETTEWVYRIHWPMLAAKARYIHADAMLAAREVKP